MQWLNRRWLRNTLRAMRSWPRWLRPGLKVKRYFGLIFLGNLLLAIGAAMFLLNIYRTAEDPRLVRVLSTIALQSLNRPLRVVIFGALGVALVMYGVWGLGHSLLAPFLRPDRPVVAALEDHRRRERGPHVVVIGGGHGQSTLLRGLRQHTRNLAAVVTVADDGGSSGRLREDLGILPPGDIRNCLAALSDEEALLTQLFQYRFAQGSGLEGHSFGNLFITALAAVTGSFEEAVVESGRVLAVQGRVYPSTLQNVRLVADVVLPNIAQDVRVEGESRIPQAQGHIRRVYLEPENPPAYPEAIRRLLAAELIAIGPGSLYTSILPNLLVPDIAAAIRASRALRIYVCNVATQRGETDGFTAGDHIRVLEEHVGEGLFDLVVCNNRHPGELPNGIEWVRVEPDLPGEYPVYQADLIDENHPWRHDPDKLARALLALLEERTGPLTA